MEYDDGDDDYIGDDSNDFDDDAIHNFQRVNSRAKKLRKYSEYSRSSKKNNKEENYNSI